MSDKTIPATCPPCAKCQGSGDFSHRPLIKCPDCNSKGRVTKPCGECARCLTAEVERLKGLLDDYIVGVHDNVRGSFKRLCERYKKDGEN